jgi:hypothetical protein
MECPYRHYLNYVQNIKPDDVSHHLDYGTVLHDTVESYLLTNEMRVDECLEKLSEAWQEKGFDGGGYIRLQESRAREAGWKYKHESLSDYQRYARTCLEALPDFLNEEFGEWELVGAEELIHEETKHDLDPDTKIYFKGFVDAIIKARKRTVTGKLKERYWIVDWKTASARGWHRRKREDIGTWGQPALYKKFWAEREGHDLKDVGCAFVLLKKVDKPDKCLQRIDVSAGPKAIAKVEARLSSMVDAVIAGRNLKNRNSCRFCDYRGTEHCDGVWFG